MNKLLSWPLALVTLLFATACHKGAVPTKSTGGPGTSVVVPPVDAAVKAVNTSFRYLTAKGKMQADLKGNKQSANVNLRLRRDSVIWLSASLVGVEGVRVLLTPDSVRMLNRLQREYFAGGYDYLSQTLGVPVTFQQVQALLLGDYLSAPTGSTPTVKTESEQQRVSFAQGKLTVEQLLSVASGRVQQVSITDAATPRNMSVVYSDFRPIEPGNLPFAHTTAVEARQGSGAGTSATLNYSKVDMDRERLNFPFSVPQSYTRRKTVK